MHMIYQATHEYKINNILSSRERADTYIDSSTKGLLLYESRAIPFKSQDGEWNYYVLVSDIFNAPD